VEIREQLHDIGVDGQSELKLQLLPHLAVKLVLVQHLLVDNLQSNLIPRSLLSCFENSSKLAISKSIANPKVVNFERFNPLLVALSLVRRLVVFLTEGLLHMTPLFVHRR